MARWERQEWRPSRKVGGSEERSDEGAENLSEGLHPWGARDALGKPKRDFFWVRSPQLFLTTNQLRNRIWLLKRGRFRIMHILVPVHDIFSNV